MKANMQSVKASMQSVKVKTQSVKVNRQSVSLERLLPCGRSFTSLRTAHSARVRNKVRSTEFEGPLKAQSPHAVAGTQLQARDEQYRRDRG